MGNASMHSLLPTLLNNSSPEAQSKLLIFVLAKTAASQAFGLSQHRRAGLGCIPFGMLQTGKLYY